VHGGDSGEINFGCDVNPEIALIKERNVFELSLEDNRKIEPKFRMPTLDEVIEYVGKRMVINIELKVPYDSE
jgi:hypothetical protein